MIHYPPPSTLTVAHLSPTFFAPRSVVGGGERYVIYLARALAAAFPDGRFAQTIIACGERDESFVTSGIMVRVLRNDNRAMGPMSATSRDLAREIASFDLVHIHQSLTLFGAYAITCTQSLGIPAIATDLGGGENSLMLDGGGLSLAAGVVSISAYAHGLAAPYAASRSLVLPGPVDTDAFAPIERAPNERPRILCVSRILPHKGIDRIIAALPPSLPLTVAGQVYDAAYQERLEHLARGKNVVFVHDADDADLISLYRSSDIFMQGSTARDCYGHFVGKPELLGLTTLEAMSCGLPVVVSDAGALPELITDQRFGRVFRDHEALVAVFDDIEQGRWPHPDAAALARAQAVEKYGFAPVGAALGAFYEQIASGVPCES